MDFWSVLEYVAWALSIILAARLIYDVVRTDTTYDNALLTSSREGELELTQERHEI
jgi:hypothetical protein